MSQDVEHPPAAEIELAVAGELQQQQPVVTASLTSRQEFALNAEGMSAALPSFVAS